MPWSSSIDPSFFPPKKVSKCSNSADADQQSSNQPKKVPYAKPIPKNFQQAWGEVGAMTASSEGQQNFSQAPPPHGGPPMGGPPGQFPHAPPGMLPPPGPDCIPLQGRLSQIISHIRFRNLELILIFNSFFQFEKNECMKCNSSSEQNNTVDIHNNIKIWLFFLTNSRIFPSQTSI